MNLITLDFETYFDQDYTLSKMTTEEYVRDPRFKVHCVGFMWPATDTGVYCLPGAGQSCIDDYEAYKIKPHSRTRPITLAEHVEGLKVGIEDAPCAVLCHHAHFDGLILNHHYGIRPAFWFDTLSMARLVFPHAKSHSLSALAKHFGLPEKTVPYNLFKGVRDLPDNLYNLVADGCKHDVELTYAIFCKLLPFVPKEELRIIDLTIRMFTEPALALDTDRLQHYLTTTQDEKENVLKVLGVTKEDLQSSERFAGLLRQVGVEPPTKSSPSNPDKTIYAFSKTDEEMKELEEHENETVQALVAARLGQKSTIGETRATRLIDMAERGLLCVYLKYCGAHTTRWSGGDKLNWQNFSRGSELRKSILAPEGYQLVIIDLAQIECRMLNWLAGEEHVLQAFRENRDLYSEGASRFYGRRITKVDKVERHLGKTLELGCGYGMGWVKFQATCRKGALGGPPIILDDDQAKGAVASYRKSHAAVGRLWKSADRILMGLGAGEGEYISHNWGPMRITGKYIVLPNGAALDYSNLSFDGQDYLTIGRNGPIKIYGAKLVENVIQALSRMVLSQAMLKIAERYKIVMTIHDEVVYLAKTEEAPEALTWGLDIMKTPSAWCNGLPLDAEGDCATNYSK